MELCFQNFVGVVDSGVGGLTILSQLQRDFPLCNFVYIADSAYCPYGIKQPSEILDRVNTLIHFLQDCGVQAVVLACNTASVYADIFRQQFSFPIYDVITPTCDRVIEITESKRVALLATNATVASLAYQRKLNDSDITVVSFPCSEFVPFVEADQIDTVECTSAVNKSLFSLPRCNVDAVILGCTHFPLLRKKIAPYTNGAKMVECCTHFQPTQYCNCKTHTNTLFLTTGVEKQVNAASKWFEQANFIHIDI